MVTFYKCYAKFGHNVMFFLLPISALDAKDTNHTNHTNQMLQGAMMVLNNV